MNSNNNQFSTKSNKYVYYAWQKITPKLAKRINFAVIYEVNNDSKRNIEYLSKKYNIFYKRKIDKAEDDFVLNIYTKKFFVYNQFLERFSGDLGAMLWNNFFADENNVPFMERQLIMDLARDKFYKLQLNNNEQFVKDTRFMSLEEFLTLSNQKKKLKELQNIKQQGQLQLKIF